MAANMNCSPATGGSQFRATQTWNALVQHLKENANVKRRRNMKKSYDESFTGSNAVDVLFHFVKQNPGQFTNSSLISRDNIVRLCQSFIDNGVFEPIGVTSDNERCVKFDDSASALYHFAEKATIGGESVKSVNSRQVLKEIDGDIRNSLDHISISSTNKKDNASITPKSKHMLIPTRRSGNRSRFPSFSGTTGQSFKESFLSSLQMSDSEEEEKIPRTGRRLKRSSSLVGMVMKRSSSESNVPKEKSSSTSSASDSEHMDGKDKKSDDIGRGGKLRLSQRLNFRKKSFSSENETETTDLKPQAKTCHIKWKKPQPTHTQAQPRVPEEPQKQQFLDPRRRSYAVRSECTKPPRAMRRMISTPNFLRKPTLQPKAISYKQVDPNENTISVERRSQRTCSARVNTTFEKPRLRSGTMSHPELKKKLAVNPKESQPSFASPPKLRKRDNDVIVETPSRYLSRKSSSYFSSLASFANRMSLRKKAQRKNEVQSCVIKNPSAANGGSMFLQTGEDESEPAVKRKLSTQELSHLRRECVRVRLLQIIDLQFVDSLITSPTDKKPNQAVGSDANIGGGITTHGVQYSEVASAYNSNDKWISSALKLLQHLPNGYNILCKYARDHCNMKKLKLFFAISEYYKSLSKPVIDESMEEIVTSIADMLTTKPVSEALEATQLFLHLLPDSVFTELKDLVSFLSSVCKSKDIVLIPTCDNKSVILQTFPSAIFCLEKPESNRIDSRASGLFLFILEHRNQVFLLPTSIALIFKRKRKLLEIGEVDSPTLVQDSTFCAMISSEEFNQQRVEFTQMQVSELARSLSSNPNLPPKKKKDLLKKLQSAHSSAYERSRGPMKATHPTGTTSTQPETPQLSIKPRQPVLKAPSSDPLTRRRNKSRQKQIYV